MHACKKDGTQCLKISKARKQGPLNHHVQPALLIPSVISKCRRDRDNARRRRRHASRGGGSRSRPVIPRRRKHRPPRRGSGSLPIVRRMYRIVHRRLWRRVRAPAIHARWRSRRCSGATGIYRAGARVRAWRRRGRNDRLLGPCWSAGLELRDASLERSDLVAQLVLAVLEQTVSYCFFRPDIGAKRRTFAIRSSASFSSSCIRISECSASSCAARSSA